MALIATPNRLARISSTVVRRGGAARRMMSTRTCAPSRNTQGTPRKAAEYCTYSAASLSHEMAPTPRLRVITSTLIATAMMPNRAAAAAPSRE